MKKFILSSLLVAILLPMGIASAQTVTTTGTSVRDSASTERAAVQTALTAYKAATTAKKLSTLITVGDNAITARQKVTSALTIKVNTGTCSTINSATKVIIAGDIATINTSLSAEKTKLDADTVLATAKTDVAIIYTNNRVFIHFVPAVNGICASEKIIELVDSTKVTGAVTALKNQGTDVTAIQASLTAAKTSATSALTLFEAVASNPGDANTTATADLKTALNDLVSAKQSLTSAKAAIDAAISTLSGTTGETTTTP